ncbi:unnamed protein product [Pleuronectes platessa]|uniref:Uncharacterized protein n=1 Tax=Pleuronectes platessa TaxID=8262 RepID=A0A9N7V8M6_PLEPL|nr:unnamed protein product [Pleuronectes platessa]
MENVTEQMPPHLPPCSATFKAGSDTITAVLLLQRATDGKHLARSDEAISINIYAGAAEEVKRESALTWWIITIITTGPFSRHMKAQQELTRYNAAICVSKVETCPRQLQNVFTSLPL